MKIFKNIREWFWPLLEKGIKQEANEINIDKIKIDKSRLHDIFKNVYDCYKEEEERRKTVESKASLFIGTITVGGTIVIGSTSNFIKGDKFELSIFLLIFLLFILTLYITRTIWFSVKALERKAYCSIAPTDFFNEDNNKQLVKDLVKGVEKNQKITNGKLDNMIMAQEYFKRAVIIIAIYSLVLLLLFISKSFGRENFVKNELPQQFEVSKADQIDLLNKSVQFFKDKDNFNLEEFAHEVIGQPEVIEKFNQYKSAYAKEYEIEIADSFTISDSAVKKQARVLKSVIKLDKNFDIHIHGNRDLIEQGSDGKGKFYKIYYQQEN
jgi:hypothetical protein